MKTIFIILLIVATINAISQNKRPVGRISQNKTTQSQPTVAGSGNSQSAGSNQDVETRQTITDRYLNGPTGNARSAAPGPAKNTATASPFAGGVHPADNASKTFDTIASTPGRNNNIRHQTTSVTIAGGNDTTFNVNTLAQSRATTISGAVDRSGQAQFGQTNWGNSRRTVGESQWTVPPPITASFNKEFPASNSATWIRNNVDTSIYSARYKSGAQWVTTSYNASGQRLNMRTEYPLVQPPRAVTVFIAKQPAGFEAVTIYKLQVQGKPDVYEIRTKNGKTVYVNNEGMEVNY